MSTTSGAFYSQQAVLQLITVCFIVRQSLLCGGLWRALAYMCSALSGAEVLFHVEQYSTICFEGVWCRVWMVWCWMWKVEAGLNLRLNSTICQDGGTSGLDKRYSAAWYGLGGGIKTRQCCLLQRGLGEGKGRCRLGYGVLGLLWDGAVPFAKVGLGDGCVNGLMVWPGGSVVVF